MFHFWISKFPSQTLDVRKSSSFVATESGLLKDQSPQTHSSSPHPLSANKEREHLPYLRNLPLSPKLVDTLDTTKIQTLNSQ